MSIKVLVQVTVNITTLSIRMHEAQFEDDASIERIAAAAHGMAEKLAAEIVPQKKGSRQI